jgi:hypothetical protein
MRTAILALLLGFPGLAGADALRCGQAVVTAGLRDFEVLERCGEPLTQRTRTEVRGYDVGPIDVYYVVVEEWVYDPGGRKLRRLLRFEDGVLMSVETLRRAP